MIKHTRRILLAGLILGYACIAPASAQYRISGKISDRSGEPLAGAAVTIRGMKGSGTMADSEGRGIDPACAREVRSLLSEVIAECRVAQSRLRGLAAARDVRDMAPLYSLKQKPRRPWWRFWEDRA